MNRFRTLTIAILLAATTFTGAFILAHGDGKRAEELKNTSDPRSHAEHQSFEQRSSLEKLAQVLAELKVAKHQMVKDGVYSCCTNQGCNMCPLMEAECTCRKNLRAGELVCTECKMGWEAGDGALADYTAADAKASFAPMSEHGGGGRDDSKAKDSHGSHDH